MQQPGELFDDFLTSLKDLASSCGFCDDCRDSLIRDRVVVGLRDGATIQRMCAVPKLTLQDAVTTCRAEEAGERCFRDRWKPG